MNLTLLNKIIKR